MSNINCQMLNVKCQMSTTLALGPESAGNFSILHNNKLIYTNGFGDLLDEDNWQDYKQTLLNHLQKNKIKPQIILTDLHPDFKTTILGQELTQKYQAKLIPVQHHHAHIFSAYGEQFLDDKIKFAQDDFIGIACDGTGLGNDDTIWGGEIFAVTKNNEIKRLAHLEYQTLLGGELAIREPARMLISILNKFLKKTEIYPFVADYYNSNQFELLYNQLRQNFNCLETSSTGRVLDAVSLLLGFCDNAREYKHAPIALLEKNSLPLAEINNPLKPQTLPTGRQVGYDKVNQMYILKTTPLFEYLINNLDNDKFALALKAQLYIAEGIKDIIKELKKNNSQKVYFAGGIANNQIISQILERDKIILNKKIPRGDEGLSFGQIWYYLYQGN